jgi:cobalt-zinc-cadmium efflux system protein
MAVHRHHHETSRGGHVNRALVWGIWLNILFVILEAAAGFWQGSLALLSDAGHNLFDVASLALALLAFRLSHVQPNDQYTYGFRKTTILVALLNAVILLVAVGGIGFEAVQRLWHPEPIQGGIVAVVAAVGILVNGATALLFLRDKDRDLNLKGAYLHMAADALVSLGVVVAGIVILFTRWYWLDPVISFVIMIVIVVSTWSLLKDSLRLSLDGVPREVNMDEVRQAALDTPGVLDIHHIHVWAMSTTQNALTAHLVVPPGTNLQQTEGLKDILRKKMEQLHVSHSTFELETAVAACSEASCRAEPSAGLSQAQIHAHGHSHNHSHS